MTDFVRASSLPAYSDCARRAATRLFRRDILAAGYTLNETPAGIGATIGTSVHAAAALTLDEKSKTGVLAPISAVTDCAVETYREKSREGVMFDRETPASSDAERQVVGMATAYQRMIAPTIEPIAVEERLEAETPFGLVLTGQSDVLARTPEDLHDLKTGKKRGSYKAQFGAYSLLSKAHGFTVTGVVEDYLPRASVKKPQPAPQSYRHDLASAETAALSVLRHIADDIRVFREGDPDRHTLPGDPWAFGANPSSMLCGPKYCAAFGTAWCREHKELSE